MAIAKTTSNAGEDFFSAWPETALLPLPKTVGFTIATIKIAMTTTTYALPDGCRINGQNG